MNKCLSILLIIIIFQHPSFSQDRHLIDSVFAGLKVKENDTNKVNTINLLAYDYLGKDPNTSIYFSNEALKLSKKLNYKLGMAVAFLQMSSGKINIGNYEEALKNCNEALNLFDQLLDTDSHPSAASILKQKASTFQNLGTIYWHLNNYSEALTSHNTSLRIREEIQDKQGIALSLNNIGIIYTELYDMPEALKHYFAALKIREEIGDRGNIAASYVNIGIIFAERGEYAEAIKNFISALEIFEEFGDKVNSAYTMNNIGALYSDQGNQIEALQYCTRALKIQSELGDKRGIASSSENMGIVYSLQGNFSEARKNLLVSLKIKEELGDKSGLAATYNNLGNVYLLEKDVKEASHYLNYGLSLANEIQDLEAISSGYFSLSELDSLLGNHKQALKHYKLYIIYRDSLYNEENTRKLIQQQLQFDFSKKVAVAKVEQEKKDVLLQQQLQKQKVIRNSFISGSILLLFLLFVIINRNKLKRTVEMERMRSKLGRDLHDDIGSTLSSINILSHTAQINLDPVSDEKTRLALEKINERCQRLLDTMGDIIWNINPGNDTMEEVMSRMRDYAATLLEAKNIDYSINFPKETVDCQLSMDVKNNMYLIFKEAMNNLSKYSDCSKVFLSLTFDDKNIQLKIEDNGKGFDKDEIKRRGGLRNMQHRAEEIKGGY
jgi:two-component system sensor histidine kinase UhpB